MRLAFGYIRRSSYKQQNNNSVEIQKQHILEFAKRNKLNVPDEFIFIEDVTSAFSKRANQRKELMRLGQKMLEMQVPILIFYDISRMDRTGYSFTIDFYRPMLEKLPNLEVYTTESNKPINPEDMNMKISFLLQQYESVLKSERAIGSLTTDLEQETKIRPGSRTPYGYNQINKQLTPNENAEIVSFIFFLYSWGQSLKKIAFLLNEANIPSPKGKEWRSSTIENILKNPVYTGDLNWNVHKGEKGPKTFLFKETHDPIINEFQLLFHKQNKHLLESFGRFDTPFLFLNKIKCCNCQEILVTQNGSTKRNGISYQYHYYVCKICHYKVNTEEVHEKLFPNILKRVQQLISTEQTKLQTIQYLNQMTNTIEELISKVGNMIEVFTKKLTIAKENCDRELELQIAEFLESHRHTLRQYLECLEYINESYQSVMSDQFFTHFSDILLYQLGDSEKRLILLYFVDYILLSPEYQTQIQFKTDIFNDFLPFSNGLITEQ
ncbi:recombinase family protein [Peribacillus simplex]|uniref:recombinase family protein n=1 Tax=Peribacillus simplex TaxID=1478 RepID=UPI003D2DE719